MNNISSTPSIDIKIYSNFLLGNYFFDNQEDEKAEDVYTTIISIPDLPKKYNNYKLQSLNKVFFIQRLRLNKVSAVDSTLVKKTAQSLINFNRSINDTLNIPYGKALHFLNKEVEAEKLFLAISKIPKTVQKFNRYSKFQALFWLNNLYYKRIGNYDELNTEAAEKLILITEDLLATVQNTDFVDRNRIYALYGDLCVASITAKNKEKLQLYESKITDLIDSTLFLNNNDFDWKKFYYTIHKLKMYFEIDENFEKAKYYASKNIELTKYVYGELSSEHEQELLSLENIIKLKMFDYETAYHISLKREKIIKKLYGEDSLEYLGILYQQHNIFLNELNIQKCLELSEKAMNISKSINCTDEKLCSDVLYNYLNALNSNNQSGLVIEKTRGLNFESDVSKLLKISKIRRDAYYRMENYIGVNVEFEWVLDQIDIKKKSLFNNNKNNVDFLIFLLDYQEHLRDTGRLNKALDISEKFMSSFNESFSFLRNQWNLKYLNILLQLNKCSKVIKFIEKSPVLEFTDITTPLSKRIDYNSFLNIKGRAYNCIGDFQKAIDSYKEITRLPKNYDQKYNPVLMVLSQLYSKTGDKEKALHYKEQFEKENILVSDLEFDELLLHLDFYITFNDRNKIMEYLIPLSNKTIETICSKSFYSNEDNTSEKMLHDETLRIMLNVNNSEFYNAEIARNSLVISNLYKKKLDLFGEINLGIQRNDSDIDILKLKELKKQFNRNSNQLLKENIEQITSKIIGNRIIEYNDLCSINFDQILNSLAKNEIIVNLNSYKQPQYNVETYTMIINTFDHSSTVTEVFLEKDKLLIDGKSLSSSFFNNLLSILEDKYKDYYIDTFYIIPSGNSNFINFSALSLMFEEKLNRLIKLHVINSLADLPKTKNENKTIIDDLLLIGDIDFDNTVSKDLNSNNTNTRGIQLTRSIDDSGMPLWGYLPGTKEEIEYIEALAQGNNINTSVLSNKKATETNIQNFIKSSKNNSIIHIATHGYFFPGSTSMEIGNLFANHQNPFLRSGLILSGANGNWNNNIFVNPNSDGILTAEEISFMDLSKVELVVLSACDTGLGDVSNLEGINGLQRAFKLAGANKLIMSLWKVPDKETAEFFQQFYKFLLTDKLSIDESFRETQKIMNQKYEPYYWASFVLLE